jgi:hypothetical protein
MFIDPLSAARTAAIILTVVNIQFFLIRDEALFVFKVIVKTVFSPRGE